MKSGPKNFILRNETLPPEMCRYLIRFFQENIGKFDFLNANPEFKHRVIAFGAINHRENEHFKMARRLLNFARLRACNFLKDGFSIPEIYPEYTELVRWPEKSSQAAHVDSTRKTTTYAAIIYLNDDYEGGETFFPGSGEEVRPKQGMMLGFRGAKILHGVRPIAKGERFTVPCWFTDQAEHSEFT
jgi:hypothetical protein